MSVNIIHVRTISGALTISDEGVKWWLEEADEVEGAPEFTRRKRVSYVRMDWSGEGSRSALVDGGLAKFLSFTKGVAEFVFVAEDGTMFGLSVHDGDMTWREVDVQLMRVCAAPSKLWTTNDS
jgi:hypothetical protein